MEKVMLITGIIAINGLFSLDWDTSLKDEISDGVVQRKVFFNLDAGNKRNTISHSHEAVETVYDYILYEMIREKLHLRYRSWTIFVYVSCII